MLKHVQAHQNESFPYIQFSNLLSKYQSSESCPLQMPPMLQYSQTTQTPDVDAMLPSKGKGNAEEMLQCFTPIDGRHGRVSIQHMQNSAQETAPVNKEMLQIVTVPVPTIPRTPYWNCKGRLFSKGKSVAPCASRGIRSAF